MVVCAGFAMLVAASLVSAENIFASNAGGGGGIHGGSCAPSGSTQWWDKCYGATWRYYKRGQRSNTFSDGVFHTDGTGRVQGSDHVDGGYISGCADTEGVYVLGLEAYNSTQRNNRNKGSLGWQRGILKNRDISYRRGQQGIPYRSDIPGVENWQIVRDHFQAAVDAGVAGTNTHRWNGSLGWFCYDPSLEKDTKTNGNFQSKSAIKTNAEGDISAHEEESDFDGKVTLRLSTDQPQINATFYHRIFYSDDFYNHDGSADTYDSVSTNWNVAQTGANSGDHGSGSLSTNASPANSGTRVLEKTETISIAAGETVTVCQKITYNPQNITMEGRRIYDSDGNYLRTHYSAGESKNTGTSEACIEITRPAPPDPNDPENPGPFSRASLKTGIYYAGETASLGWKAYTKSFPTRRFAGYQATVYQLNHSIERYNEIALGNYNTKNDTCAHARTKSTVKDCKVIYSAIKDSDLTSKFGDREATFVYGSTELAQNSPTPPTEIQAIVPDQVGDKYCNSFAFAMEYWFGVDRSADGKSATTWTHEADKDYWSVYNAVCRTIAKKPSLAIWNGSLITQGSVTASLSPRYSSPSLGQHTNDKAGAGALKTYGTWPEYLSVVRRSVSGVGSGAAFAAGSKTNLLPDNSLLTISNSDSDRLGHSEIDRNNSHLTRLETFLKSRAESVNNINEIKAKATGRGTHIFLLEGDQTLTDDLLYDSASYHSIYELPQTIIFIENGNLKISGNVQRIDAWLIVRGGTIDTCAEFAPGTDSDQGTDSAPSSICSKQLAINGPIIAESLITHRGYGADPDPAVTGTKSFTHDTNSNRTAPAEIFNLRQDAFLWAYAQAGRYDSSYTEVYSREMAPRY